MAQPILPSEVCSLFRGYWRGERHAMQIVAAPPVRALIRLEVTLGKQARMLRRQDSDADEHVHEGMIQTIAHAAKHQGLAKPADFEQRRDVGPLLRKIVHDRLVDRARRRASREPKTVLWDEHQWSALAYESNPTAPANADAERLVVYEHLLDTGALRLAHALAYGAQHDVGLIELVSQRLRGAHVADAALLRPADETADRLDYWLCNVPQAPAPARARRALAWILRSSDETDSNHWQAMHKSEADRALDLLRTWQERAETVFRVHAEATRRAALAA